MGLAGQVGPFASSAGVGSCLSSQHSALPQIPVPLTLGTKLLSVLPPAGHSQNPSTSRALPSRSLSGLPARLLPERATQTTLLRATNVAKGQTQGSSLALVCPTSQQHSPLCCSSSSSLMGTVAHTPCSPAPPSPSRLRCQCPSPPSHLTLSRGIKYPHASQLTWPVQACSSFSICGITKDILSAWDSQTGPGSVNVPHPELVTQPSLHWSQDQDSTATARVQAISPISRAPLGTLILPTAHTIPASQANILRHQPEVPLRSCQLSLSRCSHTTLLESLMTGHTSSLPPVLLFLLSPMSHFLRQAPPHP